MAYLERRPPQWRDDDRAHRLMQFLGDKRKPYEIFPSLRAIYKPDVEQDPAMTLKGSALFARILKAKDGDDVPVLRELNFR